MRHVLFALLFVACRAPKSELKEPIVVRVSIHHFEGSYEYEVDGDGNAKHTSWGRPQGDKKTVYARVERSELHDLARVLRDHRLCSKRGGTRDGVPDEARPNVAVKLEDVDCRVEMWDGEWRDDPDAHACLDALEGLGSNVAHRGSP